MECLTQELAKKGLGVNGDIGKLKVEYEMRMDELGKENFDLRNFLEEKERNQKYFLESERDHQTILAENQKIKGRVKELESKLSVKDMIISE